jgi:hypothetical protein
MTGDTPSTGDTPVTGDTPMTGGRAARRRSGERRSRHRTAKVSRHASGERRTVTSTRRWMVLAVVGALLGGLASFAAITYADYNAARTSSTGVISAYLNDIHDENYNRAWGRMCEDIHRRDTVTGFTESLKRRPGIESFVVDKSVPFRFSGPYAVTVRITEKNGNAHTSVFEVEKRNVAGRHSYEVCHLLS